MTYELTAADDGQQRIVWEPLARIPALDGVRGIAILMVAIYRFGKEGFVDGKAVGLFSSIIRYADLGVDLFFVLSGFLITGILLDTRKHLNYFSRFYARRSLRIFPLYYVSLAIFLFLVPLFLGNEYEFQLGRENQFYLWTYLTNLKMSFDNSWCFGYLDHFWSLAVEEHFYLVWPLIVYCLSAKRLLIVCLILAGLSTVSRVYVAYTFENPVAIDVLTIFRCDGLFFGAAFAIALRDGHKVMTIRRWAFRSLPFFLIVAVAIVVSGLHSFSIAHTIVALVWTSGLAILVTSNQGSRVAQGVGHSCLRTLGKYSYAMYIFQSPIIPLTSGVISIGILRSFVGGTMTATILYIVIMFALTFGLAVISWHLLEKHCLRWRPFQTSHETHV